MIHATFENGETMLFDPWEIVDTCDWISENGEYFSNPKASYARLVVKPGVYVLAERMKDGCVCHNTTKIVSIKDV